MDVNINILKARHSYHLQKPAISSTNSNAYSKSDLNLYNDHVTARTRIFDSHKAEYYKRYEYDEVPVKDSSTDNSCTSRPKHKGSLTNSDLEKMEKRIFKNVSLELQTDDCSLSSLESNIKFFKTTVERIFDNFYTSMRDFEHYKRRFHEILLKTKEGSVEDMEEFIKDMFEHIMSSENSASNTSHSRETAALTMKEACVCSSGDTFTKPESPTTVLEAYKNDNYRTDSTLDENSFKGKSSKIEEIFNIFLLGGNPGVEIKINDRNLLSEIHIREPSEIITTGSIASADNLKKRAAKKLEVARYVRQPQDHNTPDRDIPVKISNAKKNIYLDEDFACNDSTENSKSLISKICNILCRKFRKSSFG